MFINFEQEDKMYAGDSLDQIYLCPLCQSKLVNWVCGLACPFHGYNIWNRTDSDNQTDKYKKPSWRDLCAWYEAMWYMKINTGQLTLNTDYGTLTVLEDYDQRCIQIWYHCGGPFKDYKIKIDCNHIKIIPTDKE